MEQCNDLVQRKAPAIESADPAGLSRAVPNGSTAAPVINSADPQPPENAVMVETKDVWTRLPADLPQHLIYRLSLIARRWQAARCSSRRNA